MVAGAAVAVAAIGGIAAILGWIPGGMSGDSRTGVSKPAARIAGTAPPESLSPGETLVPADAIIPGKSVDPSAKAVSPLPEKSVNTMPVAPESAPAAPAVTAAPASKPAPSAKKTCPNCGTVTTLSYRSQNPRGFPWEVTVAFDDGTRGTLRYPANPGFRAGDRVLLSNGRLQKN
jgi:hypothetical protein